MDGVALPAHGAGFDYVASLGMVAVAGRRQRPNPGLNLSVVEPEYFIQSANTLIVPGGHNIGVKGTNDLTGEVLDYSTGRKFALEKFPGISSGCASR